MKKVILGMMVVLAFAACNSSNSEKVETTDSTSVAVDTAVVVVDSVKVDTLSK